MLAITEDCLMIRRRHLSSERKLHRAPTIYSVAIGAKRKAPAAITAFAADSYPRSHWLYIGQLGGVPCVYRRGQRSERTKRATWWVGQTRLEEQRGKSVRFGVNFFVMAPWTNKGYIPDTRENGVS